jgi:CubicO group peptidase (beta-lactamase class C family)
MNLEDPFFATLPQRVDEYAREHALPGIAVGVVDRGRLAWTYGTGETKIGNGLAPTSSSVFRIASMTKSFTASAILLLRDRGALRLDDPIATYLPWTATIGAPPDARAITVRDLLTMNAGFPTDDPWGDRQENAPIAAFDALVENGLSFARPPGTGFEYSNLGYALLGRIVTRVSGRDYPAFVAGELLAPLGMRSTRFDTREIDDATRAHGYHAIDGDLVSEPAVTPGAFSPMGGLHSSIEDLTTWVRGFASALAGETSVPHPLALATRREMQMGRTFARTTSHEATSDAPAKVVTGLYGYGLFIDEDSQLGRFVHHSGGYPGFGSHMRWHASSGYGIVALANKTYAPTRTLAAAILEDIVARFAPSQSVASMLWPQTREMMEVAERLLTAWDDALADATFAVNVDLDLPRVHRRLALARAGDDIGRFEREPATLRSDSPAHAKWHVRGDRGDAEIEIQLTPERPPKLQTLSVSVIRAADSASRTPETI